MTSPTSPTNTMPTRSVTDDGTTGLGDDASEVNKLFHERLQAWKHACAYLEDYVKATEKLQHAHGKEYEKVLKTVNQPLKEGDHFDRNQGGIAEMFDTIRQNTMGMTNSHNEAAKALKGIVLPVFERLHAEIKAKQSEIQKGAGKSTKALDKARAETQKYVEKLGTNSATYHTTTSKPDPYNDPYVIQRGVYHRLNKQIQEENTARQDMLTIQETFSQFEAHIVQMFQEGMQQFQQTVIQQCDQQKYLYVGMTESAQKIDSLFEWHAFVRRNTGVLIDPKASPRTVATASFPNQDHESTKPLCQGSLDRKGGLAMLKKHETGFYAATPARYLHEFTSEDDYQKDPTPEMSLYLPDCTIGGLNGNIFTVKGKDISGGLGGAMHREKEFEFRAHSQPDAEKWYEVIKTLVSANTVTSPVSRSATQRSTSSTSATSPSASTKESSAISPTAGTTASPVTSPTVAADEKIATDDKAVVEEKK